MSASMFQLNFIIIDFNKIAHASNLTLAHPHGLETSLQKIVKWEFSSDI